MTFLVDSHCHLGSLSYQNKQGTSLKEIIKRAYNCKVTHFLSIACTPDEFTKQQKLTEGFENIFMAAGVHPLNLDECPDYTDDDLLKCFNDPRTIALGETGLDYHYAKETSQAQKISFARQIALAHEVKKPLIIHAREAKVDTLDIMRAENARDVGGVLHCFTDTVDMARQCLDLGFYISFTGISTFKASDNVREVVKYVPLDRMMVETDCPYLSPIPVRGVENEPAFVRYTLNFLSEFKKVSQRQLAAITSKNFSDLFKVNLKEPLMLDLNVSDFKLNESVLTPLKD